MKIAHSPIRGAITAIAVAVALSHSSPAKAKSGQEGNGGGGIVRGGQYMTFYSAGLYAEPKPVQQSVQVPNLDRVVAFIERFPFLSHSSKADLVGTLLPSSSHSYFRAIPSELTPEILDRLLAEFHRVTGVPTGSL